MKGAGPLFYGVVTICVVILLNGALGTFDPDNMDEGYCPYFKRVKKVDTNWLTRQGRKGWYFPILSGKNANIWKVILTGKPLQSEAELDGMCLFLFVQGNIITATGYGQKAVFNCTTPILEGDGIKTKKACHPTNDSSFPEFAKKGVDSTMGISWTDNVENLVSVRCITGSKVWALISTTPSVDDRVENEIMIHIRSLGFSSAKAVKINYNNCKKPQIDSNVIV